MTAERSIYVDLFEPDQLQKLQETVDNELAPPVQLMERALSSTCIRMAAWLRTRAVKQLSAKFGIKQKTLRRRFMKFSIKGKIRGGELWMGLRGIPFINLNPVQTDKGVVTKEGGYYEEGAFITKVRGKTAVLRRKGKTWAGKKDGKWKRGPVETPTVRIYDPCVEWLKRAIQEKSYKEHFYTELERQVRWQMSKM